MKELIHTVGVILRFPFFCLGVLLWAVLIMPLAVVLMFLQILCIPWVFISSAFDGDPEKFESHIKDTFSFRHSMQELDDMKRWLLQPDPSSSSSSHWTDGKRARYNKEGKVTGYEDKD